MKKLFITLFLFAGLNISLSAEENMDKQVPDVSIGINGNYGIFDIYDKNMNLDIKPGMYTGGGVSVEKNLYGNIDIGSGIQYRYFNTRFVMNDTPSYDVKWTFQTINIPVIFLYSLRKDAVGLSFYLGGIYSHIFYSVMKTDTTLTLDKYKDNALRFTNANQAGVTAGITMRFKVTDFSDFIFGAGGEYYPTNLLYSGGGSKDKLHMINYSLTSGWMFRTNFFSRP